MPFYRNFFFQFFLFLAASFYGQPFQNTYGAATNLQAWCVRQTTDAGFIICGNITIDSTNTDLCLLKTNAAGDTLWMRTYGGPAGEYEGVVQQTFDGGYVILGTTNSFGAGQGDILLIKTNSVGDTLWTRTYGGSGDEIGQSIVQSPDSGYVIAGHTDSFGARGEFYLIRTNSLGDTVWTRTYGGPKHDHAFSVIRASDNSIVMGGHSVSFSTNGGFYAVKTTANGDTLWTRGYGGNADSYCYSVAETNDGGFILTGTTSAFGAGNTDAMVVRINALGDTLWSRTYGNTGDEFFNCVKTLPGGGYILAGATTRGTDSSNVYLVKINENGDTLWTRFFGGLKDDEGTFVEICSDSSYVVCGNTRSTLSGRSEIYLLRMDKNGNANCSWFRTNTIISKPDSVMYRVATTVASYSTNVGTAALISDHVSLNKTDGCAVFGIPHFSYDQVIKLYPNPVSGVLNVSSEKELTLIRIYDSMGRVCYEEKNSTRQSQVNMEHFAPGLYLVEAAGQHFRVIKK